MHPHLGRCRGAARVCAFCHCPLSSARLLCRILRCELRFLCFRLRSCLLVCVGFGPLLCLSLQSLFLCLLFRCARLALVLLPLALLFFFLFNSLDAWIEPKRKIDESSDACVIFLLASCSFGFVLLLRVALVIAAMDKKSSVPRQELRCRGNSSAPIAAFIHLFIKILKTPPGIEFIPKIVEAMDFLLGGIHITEQWDRGYFRESGFPLENRSEAFEECVRTLAALFLQVGGIDVVFEGLVIWIYRVELTASFRVGEYF